MSYEKRRGHPKKTVQFDLDTGEIVGEYKSLRDAAKDNWIDYLWLLKKAAKGNGIAIYKSKGMKFVTE